MGMLRKSSIDNYRLPNPNPGNFLITRFEIEGDYLIALVNYPDCTTFGGDKILVYSNRTLVASRIRRRLMDYVGAHLDPHLLGSQHDPVARFPGNATGWRCAEIFARAMTTASESETETEKETEKEADK